MTGPLFIALFSTEVRRRMSYRLDFWISLILNFIAAVVIPWFFWGAIFASSGGREINGYSLTEMLLYVCLSVLVGRLVRGAEFVEDVANDIYQGTLNRYLLYPAGYLNLKYAQHLGALLSNMLQAFIFLPLVVWIVGSPGELSLLSLAMALPIILLANLLYYLMVFPIQAIAFWADNVWSLVVMTRMAAGLLGGGMIPLALFPDRVSAVLQVLPFACFFDLPIRTMLGQVGLREWLAGLALVSVWCVIFYAVGQLLWRKGERSYSGVGI